MRANECKYYVFYRKVRNHKTCAAFISFPNLLVVNLARNVDTVKCGKKVSLSRYVQIKGKDCSDLDAMYELVSMVVHLGEKVEGGHFVCYFFLNGNNIIEMMMMMMMIFYSRLVTIFKYMQCTLSKA